MWALDGWCEEVGRHVPGNTLSAGSERCGPDWYQGVCRPVRLWEDEMGIIYVKLRTVQDRPIEKGVVMQVRSVGLMLINGRSRT